MFISDEKLVSQPGFQMLLKIITSECTKFEKRYNKCIKFHTFNQKMIREALTCIATELNARKNSGKIPAIVSAIKTNRVEHENQLVLSLVNIEEELSLRNFAEINNLAPPTLHINLYVLITADFNPSDYEESLDSISQVISFFHQKPVFTPQNTKMPGKYIEKFIVEFYNVDINTFALFCETVGVNNLPSVLYKIRLHYLPV